MVMWKFRSIILSHKSEHTFGWELVWTGLSSKTETMNQNKQKKSLASSSQNLIF